MAKLKRSRKVAVDIARIYRYIATDSPSAGRELLDRFDKNIRTLADFPEIGILKNEIREGCRILLVQGYRVLYEYDSISDEVLIVRIIEPYRDISNIDI